MIKLTTQDFINASKKIHGDTYDYSITDYKNSRTKLFIRCKEHGLFSQLPSQHLRGQGCNKCTNNFFNLEKFIEKCSVIHENKYDYSQSIYTGSKNKIKIICPIHGEFEQTANEHLRGRGCKKCGINNHSQKMMLDKTMIIQRAKDVHGDIYDYSKVEYAGMSKKITIGCPIHGYFTQRVDVHINNKHKCPKCNPRQKKTKQSYIEQINQIHGNKYDYSKVEYRGVNYPIKIICNKHGEFTQIAGEHARGVGCRLCAIETLKLNQEEALNRFKEIHGDTYDYSLVNYSNSIDKVKIICKDHGIFEQRPNNHIMGQGCPKCNSVISKMELELYDFISQQGILVEQNNRKIIPPLELDIIIPDKKIAIEFNGNYWHSELGGKDKDYHLNKTKMCNSVNIQLLHFFESEWLYKKDIVKSLINSKLGTSNRIYARNCKIVEVDTSYKNLKLNEWHLQGEDKSSVKLGLSFEGDIVSIMTFCKSRFTGKYEWELSRFASKLNTTIIGGASKLLNHFEKKYNPKNIVSYANKRYSNGNLYKQLNFIFKYDSPPNYFYSKGNMLELLTRQNFQKHKLKSKLDIFNPELSEWENMKNNGYNRIWDCGNGVWVKYY